MNRLPLVVLPLLSVGLTGCFIFPDQSGAELQPVPGPPAAVEPMPAPLDPMSADAMAGEPGGDASAMSDASLDPADSITIGPALAELTPPPEPAPQLIRTYTVEKGDSFWKIAKKVYGDPMRMKDIEAANPDVDPMKLRVGDEIVLPE